MPTNSISPPPSKRRKVPEPASAPSRPEPRHQLTVYAWNVDGIAPFLQRSITAFFGSKGTKAREENPQTSLRDFLRRHKWPTMLFLQEVKLSPDDAASRRSLEKAVQSSNAEPDYVVHVCLPSDKFNARGFGRKVYGVCSIIRKDFVNEYVDRVRTVDWDAEGRFLVLETKATDTIPRLAIFNIYAVNGTDNVYKDPATGEAVGTRHDRKREVHQLLAAECQRLQASGFYVVLAGDMNIARERIDGWPNLRTFPHHHVVNRADFEARFFVRRDDSDTTPSHSTSSDADTEHDVEHEYRLGMIDTFRHIHGPNKKGFSYYPRTRTFGESCDRVDMIMVSRNLEDHIIDAGMHETIADRGTSDHVPIFVRLAFGQPSRAEVAA